MMGKEEVSVAVVNSSDVQIGNGLRFKLKYRDNQWSTEVTSREPCAKKQDVKELENSFGQKEQPKEVSYVDRCSKVSSPNFTMKESALSFQTMSIQKIEETVGDDQASLHQNNEFANTDDNCYGKLLGTPYVNTGQYTKVVQKTDGPSSSYVHHEPFDQRSYIDAPGGQEGMINKPRSSGSICEQKRNTRGCTTKRGSDLHRLLFLPKGLQDGTKLAYCVEGKNILKGYKHGNGIVCSHCNTEISPSRFEAHAGFAAKRQPYLHISTTDGHTLHEIALHLSDGQSIVPNSDVCAVCRVGGELIVCDGCLHASHAVCLGLKGIPTGDWQCSNCTENQPDVCVVCRGQNFSVDTFDEQTVMLCDQCEKGYHVGCLRGNGLCDLKELPKGKWFCCGGCKSVHLTMQSLVYKGNEVLPDAVIDAVNKKHLGKAFTNGAANSMHWRVLSGKSGIPEQSPLLSKAAEIFRNWFKNIISESSRNLIHDMVYGIDISGQESGEIYCVVLIVNSVVVSAGLLRILGKEIAELPIVATRRKKRGKGYFGALFSCIERLLISMNVKRIVLPAAEEAESMWIDKLGFEKISAKQLSTYKRDFRLNTFEGSSMLEKELLPV